MSNPARWRLCTLSIVGALSALTAAAQSGEDAQSDDEAAAEALIITIGTRMSNRTATESSAPVDIIVGAQLDSAGVTDLGALLRTLVPSFNMNNTTTADGQDLMRPATLRGLGPDQVLVLVNGKRQHQQAVVAVQQNVGRGSAGTDMNAIPVTAIDRIEVLRDGAAAQYGSDAIAGVINIILKRGTDTRIWAQYGETSKGDGENRQIGINTGFGLGDDGFLNLSFEWQDKEMINRANETDWFGDAPYKKQWLLIGEAPTEARQLWFNASLPTTNGELYAFGGFGERSAESLGFYREISGNRQLASIYPDGITPKLGTQSEDTAWTVGYKTAFNDHWDLDLSYSSGENRFEFRNLQSLNVSYGDNSPTSAYDGALVFKQETFNLGFAGTVAWGVGQDDLAVAFGLERRHDGYAIEAGDEVSYARGSEVGFPGAIDCHPRATSCDPTDADDPNDPNDTFFIGTPPGMQGFQGYRPEHEIDTMRDNLSFYVDTEGQFTDRWSMGMALRFEDYSDFGNALTGKLSSRLQISDDLAMRATLSTGFRAPGVQQEHFTQRSISLNSAGELTDLVTLRPGSTLAKELGFADLKEETSESLSWGLIYTGDIWTSTLDAYVIDIEDRVVYSQAINAGIDGGLNDEVIAFFARHAAESAGGDGLLDGVANVEVFTNAADTRTKGVDWVNTWRLDTAGGLRWMTEASLHWGETEITGLHSASSVIPIANIVDAGMQVLIEEAQPDTRAVLSEALKIGDFTTTLRATYYSEYSDHPAVYGVNKQTFGAKTIFDWTWGYAFGGSGFKLSGGVLNLLDEYPDAWEEGGDFRTLGFEYGWNSVPFGLAGRQYFLRGEYSF